MWTTLDLVDGLHQMPLKREHRYITCMSTPQGTKQWTVQVMGLKNAGTQFQRMMEWVLRDHPKAESYIDDVIVGSEGETLEEALQANFEDVRAVLRPSGNSTLFSTTNPPSFRRRCSSVATSCVRGGGVPPRANVFPFKTGNCRRQSLSSEASWG